MTQDLPSQEQACDSLRDRTSRYVLCLLPAYRPRYSNVQQQVQIGDTVRIIARDGGKRTMQVSDVTLQVLYGEGPNTFDDGKVLLNDISSLEKKKDRRYTNSSLMVYGGIGLGFLILYDANKDGDLAFDNN